MAGGAVDALLADLLSSDDEDAEHLAGASGGQQQAPGPWSHANGHASGSTPTAAAAAAPSAAIAPAAAAAQPPHADLSRPSNGITPPAAAVPPLDTKVGGSPPPPLPHQHYHHAAAAASTAAAQASTTSDGTPALLTADEARGAAPSPPFLSPSGSPPAGSLAPPVLGHAAAPLPSPVVEVAPSLQRSQPVPGHDAAQPLLEGGRQQQWQPGGRQHEQQQHRQQNAPGGDVVPETGGGGALPEKQQQGPVDDLLADLLPGDDDVTQGGDFGVAEAALPAHLVTATGVSAEAAGSGDGGGGLGDLFEGLTVSAAQTLEQQQQQQHVPEVSNPHAGTAGAGGGNAIPDLPPLDSMEPRTLPSSPGAQQRVATAVSGPRVNSSGAAAPDGTPAQQQQQQQQAGAGLVDWAGTRLVPGKMQQQRQRGVERGEQPMGQMQADQWQQQVRVEGEEGHGADITAVQEEVAEEVVEEQQDPGAPPPLPPPPPPPPPHIVALEQAEAAERTLMTGGEGGDSDVPGGAGGGVLKDTLVATLMSRLEPAKATWPDAGIFDARGGVLGSHLAMRVDVVGAFAEPLSRLEQYGTPQALAMFRSCVALGMSSGLTLVLMPRSADAASGGGGGGTRAALMRLGEPRSQFEAVSCCAFSGGGTHLVVGHLSGEVAFWEYRRAGWEAVKVLRDAHHEPVVAAAFLEDGCPPGPGGGGGSGSLVAVTGDARGRLVLHNVSGYLSITALLAGRLSRGPQPLLLTEGAAMGPVVGLLPLRVAPLAGRAVGASDGDVARAFFFQDGGSASPDGVFLLLCLTAVYVCRATTEGRLHVLHTITPPEGVRQDVPPYAAWTTHGLHPVDGGGGSGGGSSAGGASTALLAVCWESKVRVMVVPLTARASRPSLDLPLQEDGSAAVGGTAILGSSGGGSVSRRRPSFGRAAATKDGGSLAEDAAAALAAVTPLVEWELKHLATGLMWVEGSAAAASAVASAGSPPQPPVLSIATELGPTTHLDLFELLLPEAAGGSVLTALALAPPGGASPAVAAAARGEVGAEVGASSEVGVGVALRERVGVEDGLVGHQLVSNREGVPEVAHHSALAGSGDRLVLLMAGGGLRVTSFMTWQDRLINLRDCGLYTLALGIGMDMWATRQALGSSSAGGGGAAGTAGRLGSWPGSGEQRSDKFMWRVNLHQVQPGAISTFLITLLLAYLDSALAGSAAAAAGAGAVSPGPAAGQQQLRRQGAMPAEWEEAVRAAADTCCQLCICLGRADILFRDGFRKFAASSPPLSPRVATSATAMAAAETFPQAGADAAGVTPLGVFLECLLPYVVGGLLPALDPEVVQSLVEHFSSVLRQPEAVERAVLHLDIPSLDFNQVARLCRRHRLYRALAYIFNRGLGDYTTPACELLLEVAQGLELERRQQQQQAAEEVETREKTAITGGQEEGVGSEGDGLGQIASAADTALLPSQPAKPGAVEQQESVASLSSSRSLALVAAGEGKEGAPAAGSAAIAAPVEEGEGGLLLSDAEEAAAASSAGGLSDLDDDIGGSGGLGGGLSDLEDDAEDLGGGLGGSRAAMGGLSRGSGGGDFDGSEPRELALPAGSPRSRLLPLSLPLPPGTSAAAVAAASQPPAPQQQDPAAASAAAPQQQQQQGGAAAQARPRRPVGPEPGWRQRYGYKLLVYLRTTACRGEAFPPGGAKLPPELRPAVKAALLGWMVLADLPALHQLLPGFEARLTAPLLGQGGKGGGAAAAAGGCSGPQAAAAAATRTASVPASVPGPDDLLPGPHPVLRCLVRMDAAATLQVLSECLAGWDALAVDLADALGVRPTAPSRGAVPPPPPLPPACSATQLVVDAILKLVEVGAFEGTTGGESTARTTATTSADVGADADACSTPAWPSLAQAPGIDRLGQGEAGLPRPQQAWEEREGMASSSGGQPAAYDGTGEEAAGGRRAGSGAAAAADDVRAAAAGGPARALALVARLLAEGRASAPGPSALLRVLRHVAEGPWPPDDAPRTPSEQEELFIGVLQNSQERTGHVDSSAGAGGLDQAAAHRQALLLAQAAGLPRSEACVHHLLGDTDAAMRTLLRVQDGRPPPVFEYLTRALHEASAQASSLAPGPARGPGLTATGPQQPLQQQQQHLRSSVLRHVAGLVEADAAATARLVLGCLPDEHLRVVTSLNDHPQLQFSYLKESIAVAAAAADGAYAGSGGGGGATLGEVAGGMAGSGSRIITGPGGVLQHAGSRRGSGGGGGHVAPHQQHEQLLLSDPALCERFVELLCRFEPASVLPFLQGHDAYRVQAVLPCCQRHGVQDAQAYLLERLGDIHAALRIYVGDMRTTTQDLIAAVMQGGEQQPPGAGPGGEPPASAAAGSTAAGTPLKGGAPGDAKARGGGNATFDMGRVVAAARAGSISQGTDAGSLLTSSISTGGGGSVERAGGSGVGSGPALEAARSTLRRAVALCQRHTMDTPQEVAQDCWFTLLEVYVAQLRDLRQRFPGHQAAVAPVAARAAVQQQQQQGQEEQQRQDQQDQRLYLLQRLLTSFMEEVIAAMAGYVPLKSIGQRIIQRYRSDQFGDFKATLTGLLAAYHYEASILATASKLTDGDAFRIMHSAYKSRTRSCAPHDVSVFDSQPRKMSRGFRHEGWALDPGPPPGPPGQGRASPTPPPPRAGGPATSASGPSGVSPSGSSAAPGPSSSSSAPPVSTAAPLPRAASPGGLQQQQQQRQRGERGLPLEQPPGGASYGYSAACRGGMPAEYGEEAAAAGARGQMGARPSPSDVQDTAESSGGSGGGDAARTLGRPHSMISSAGSLLASGPKRLMRGFLSLQQGGGGAAGGAGGAGTSPGGSLPPPSDDGHG